MAGKPWSKQDGASDRDARVEAALEREGAPPDVARTLARGLAELVQALGPAAGDALRAATSAVDGDARAGSQGPAPHPPTDVDEIQRLMLAFVGELKKLDEALKVLAAYLARMRDSSAVPSDRVLH